MVMICVMPACPRFFFAMLMTGKVAADGAYGSLCTLNRVCACVGVCVCSMCVAFAHVCSRVKFMFLGLSVKN